MINVLLSGAFGKMGRTVASCLEKNSEIKILCGVDRANSVADFPVYSSFSKVEQKPDVIIDFSSPAALDDIIEFALKNNTPVIFATTGYSEAQTEKIREISKKIPVFFSFNMSLGINLLSVLAKKAFSVLGDDFDIEIIEKHHNQKVDAPSGTAIMLANAINEEAENEYRLEYDRHSRRQKRPHNEIGIHSLRGGTIVGEHEIVFAGRDEVITLSHSAASKEIFAVGAIRAAGFIYDKQPGLYDMSDVLKF